MTFNVSPSVRVDEFDLLNTVPAIAATPACIAGIFRWGPMFQRILLGSQADQLKRFFKPSNLNGETWFTLFNYLAYGSQAWVVRTGDVTGNTIEQTFVGNSSNFACQAGNSVVQLSNTGGISVGMKLMTSNNTT